MAAFAALAPRLGWRAGDIIVALWAYFDESGEHDPVSGHLTRLTIAGMMAREAEWEAAMPAWIAPLGGRVFHMNAFEAGADDFAFTREQEPERRRLLNDLLDAVTSQPLQVVGISMPIEPTVSNRRPLKDVFRRTYAKILTQVLSAAATNAFLGYESERLNLVFARHGDFSEATIGKYCDEIRKNVPYLGTCTTSTPALTPELQIADLVAYEVKRFAQNRDVMRYPWLRLLQPSHVQPHIDIRHPKPGVPRVAS